MPFLETFIFDLVIKTYSEPKSIRNSLNITAYIRLIGIYDLSHIIKIINTTLSVKGSKIIPNLETKLYFLATIPSNESESPIMAIMIIKMNGLKSFAEKLINRYKDKKNLEKPRKSN